MTNSNYDSYLRAWLVHEDKANILLVDSLCMRMSTRHFAGVQGTVAPERAFWICSIYMD
jgi:hypothetical protein